MRIPTPIRPARRRMPRMGARKALIVVAATLTVLTLSLRTLAVFYTDFLWFDELGFSDTWKSLLMARIVPGAIFGSIFFVLVLVNLIVAGRLRPKYRSFGPEDEIVDRYLQIVGSHMGRLRVGVALAFGLVAGIAASAHWQEWILFRNAVDFGTKDPQFHRDIGFYVFQLPFLQFVIDWVFGSLMTVIFVVGVVHYLNGGIRLQPPFRQMTAQVKAHLSVLMGLLALTKAVGYQLAGYHLAVSARGFVEGASYTDVKAQIPAFRLLVIISIAAAILFLVNIRLRGFALPATAVGLWVFVSIAIGAVYPAVVQRFQVSPNEFAREKPYIERNIKATRAGFGLSEVEVETFDYAEDLTSADLAENRVTLENARLWDPGVSKDTLQTLQELNTFYQFNDVDIDRYEVDGRITQVILAARELNSDELPSQTWINRQLVYTHGYGAVVAPANAVTEDGEPEFLLSDFGGDGGDIDLSQPAIYYGENLDGYALVGGKVAEYDRPNAKDEGTDKTVRYSGDGGIPLGNTLRQAAFAARFWEIDPLISKQVDSDTRVLIERDIKDRVAKAAPFLSYDNDAYPVILDGRVLWVIDAFTTTDRYPYSQAVEGSGDSSTALGGETFNYVRNSVKATVDAYDGTVHFYVTDPDDPIVQAYRKAFPELFTDAGEMPEGLDAHLRYPEDLFRVQTSVYGRYHVTGAQAFYQSSEKWEVSPDPDSAGTAGDSATTTAAGAAAKDAGSSSARMDPYYLMMRLPGQKSEEFLMLRPFVPVSEGDRLTNLVAFMVAKSDPKDYGKLVTYAMPKGTSVKGPAQIASLINTTPSISEKFTLLDKAGSRVVKGSLQLIPIGDSILYIRPIYVEAEGGTNLPKFKFVAMVYGEKAVMETSVDKALAALFGDSGAPPNSVEDGSVDGSADGDTDAGVDGGETDGDGDAGSGDIADLLARASAEYALAQAALREGDLATYQEHIEAMAALVEQADALSREIATSTTTTTTTAMPVSPVSLRHP